MLTLGIFFIAAGWCLKAHTYLIHIGERCQTAGWILVCLDLAVALAFLIAVQAAPYMPHLWKLLS